MARILVAEDDRDLRQLLAGILDDDGHEVYEAENGADTLEKLEINEPDLLLLDLMMPVLDGFEVMEQMKDISAAEGLPIIILSSVPPRKGEAKAWKLGARHYIPKPFNPTRVGLSVKVALRDAVEADEAADRMSRDRVFRPGSVDQMGEYDVGKEIIRTGHEYLDLILSGGIHVPSLVLVERDGQTGKGALSQTFSYEALQAGNGVTYFTSENSPKHIIEQMQSYGMDILDYIDSALFHVPRLQQPIFGDRCEWAVSPERLMISLIEDLQSYAIEESRMDAIDKLCDVHLNLETSALGDNKGTLLTVLKAHGKNLTSRNTVALSRAEIKCTSGAE